MAEYIDRAAAHEAIINNGYIDDMLKDLYEIPAADVAEVRHGRWVISFNFQTFTYDAICSNCGRCVPAKDMPIYKYCPHCGAKMDEEADE